MVGPTPPRAAPLPDLRAVPMIGVAALLLLIILIAGNEAARWRAAKREAELYRRDRNGRWS